MGAVRRQRNFQKKASQCKTMHLTCREIPGNRCDGHRDWHDLLVSNGITLALSWWLTSASCLKVTSNMVFVAAALVSFLVGQWVCGSLQLMAFVCSTIYHRLREKHVSMLLADAVVSGTLGIIAAWAFFQAITKFPVFAVFSFFMGLSCIFLMVYCDLPGHPRYDFWHLMWHMNSGIGTMAVSLFLSHYFPHFDILFFSLL